MFVIVSWCKDKKIFSFEEETYCINVLTGLCPVSCQDTCQCPLKSMPRVLMTLLPVYSESSVP